jgi:hypothetical protein
MHKSLPKIKDRKWSADPKNKITLEEPICIGGKNIII